MIPQFPNGHPIFDQWPIAENFPCPVSNSRLKVYQKQIDRIAGRNANGKSNVRVIWTSDPAVAMHIINDEPKARYAIRTEQYECTRTDPATGLEIVEFVDVDICAPRFVFEQYHTPEEAEYNPAAPQPDNVDGGYYTHLFTVSHHDETCCDGREAVNGQLCFGAYQEPAEKHLNHLQSLIRMRDELKQTRMVGERLTDAELMEYALRLKAWREVRDSSLNKSYYDRAMDSLKTHGWRFSNTDAGKKSKSHVLEGN